MEFYINLFKSDNTENNRPHYKALFKIDGVEHECAFWPNKDGKKGLSGKAKVKQSLEEKTAAAYKKVEAALTPAQEDQIPF